jgi:hypothetical protein
LLEKKGSSRYPSKKIGPLEITVGKEVPRRIFSLGTSFLGYFMRNPGEPI